MIYLTILNTIGIIYIICKLNKRMSFKVKGGDLARVLKDNLKM